MAIIFAPCSLEKFCSVITYISQALHNYTLCLQHLLANQVFSLHQACYKLHVHHKKHLSPVASFLPRTPPCVTGLPVTQPMRIYFAGMHAVYVSSIHAISRSPVP